MVFVNLVLDFEKFFLNLFCPPWSIPAVLSPWLKRLKRLEWEIRGWVERSGLDEDLSHGPFCKIKGICLLFSLLLPSCSFKYKLFKESYIKNLDSSLWQLHVMRGSIILQLFPISCAGFRARVCFFFPQANCFLLRPLQWKFTLGSLNVLAETKIWSEWGKTDECSQKYSGCLFLMGFRCRGMNKGCLCFSGSRGRWKTKLFPKHSTVLKRKFYWLYIFYPLGWGQTLSGLLEPLRKSGRASGSNFSFLFFFFFSIKKNSEIFTFPSLKSGLILSYSAFSWLWRWWHPLGEDQRDAPTTLSVNPFDNIGI